MPRHSIEHVESNAVPSASAVRAELDAILDSGGFRKSERQARFLRFVCEAVLNGEGAKLNELLIAQAVFDRGVDYSPGEDSVVRRQAYSVRQKLQDYYASEGKLHAVRIGLPVGRYVPQFTFASPEQNAPASAEARLETAPPEPIEPAVLPARHVAPGRRRFVPLAWLALAVALSAGSFALGWRVSTRSRSARPKLDPALAEIWGEWLTNPQKVAFCLSNPLLGQIFTVQDALSKQVLPNLIEFTDPQVKAIRNQLNMPSGGYMYLLPLPGTNAKMGEALGSIWMSAFFARAGLAVQGTQSRLLSWDDFRNENVVLLGHPESNRWLDPILSKLPLRLGPWQADKPTRVINTVPAKGEPAEYDADGRTTNNGRREAYALVSMIQGLDGRHQLALIDGLSTEGTEIAEEMLTDPLSARRLLAALRSAAPRHSGPWHFQMLLRADVHGNVPTLADLVIVRVLGDSDHLL